jgi:hypothetical protein
MANWLHEIDKGGYRECFTLITWPRCHVTSKNKAKFKERERYLYGGGGPQDGTQATPHRVADKSGDFFWRNWSGNSFWRLNLATRIGGPKGRNATYQITQQRSNISRCFFHTKMCIPFLLLIAVANCAHLLSTCLAGENGALYSEIEPIKGALKWAAGLSRLHSILQATSLWRTVYTRTKSATTAHVEQWVLCSFSHLNTAAHNLHFQHLYVDWGYRFKTPVVKRSLSLVISYQHLMNISLIRQWLKSVD